MNTYIWPLTVCGIVFQIGEQVIAVFLRLREVRFFGERIFSSSFYLLFRFGNLGHWFILNYPCWFLLGLNRLSF